MNLRRVSVTLLAIAALAVTAACGSGGNDDDDDDDDGGSSSSSTPRATRTARPTATPQAPTFAEGDWTAGQAQVTVSGGATTTVEGTLLVRSSTTEGKPERQTTHLTYTKGLDTITISISTQYHPFSMGVSKQPVYIDEGTCVVTYKSKEENRIEGSFKCTDVDVEQGGNGEPTTTEGTFFATR